MFYTMNSKVLYSLFLFPILTLSVASGANRVVQVGDAIQTSVGASSSGDVVIVRGGTFPEQSVTITKPIRLVREKGSTVTIGGTIRLSGVNGDIVLRDFAINLNGNGKLIIQNCSKVGLEDLTQLPQGVEISNSTVVMRSCQLANLTISGNSDVQVIDSTLANLTTTGSKVQAVNSTMQALSATDSNLTLSAGSTHTTGSIIRGQTLYHGATASGHVSINASDWRAHGTTFKGTLTSANAHSKLLRSVVEKSFSHNGTTKDCVVFQSTVGIISGDVLYSDANRTWVTYSDLHHARQLGGTEAHFIRNRFLCYKVKGHTALNLIGENCAHYVNNNYFYSTNNNANTWAVLFSNSTQVHNDSSSFGMKKSITVSPSNLIPRVTNLIHQNESWSAVITECYMKFYYQDGTTANSNTNTQNYNWSGTKTYTNPNPHKSVTKVEVYLRNTRSHSSSYRAHEKDTKLHSSRSGINIVLSKKVSIHNNLFRRWDEYGHCILIGNAPNDGASIHGNAFWRDSGTWRVHAVNAPAGGECSHNFFHSANTGHTVTGGIAHFDNVLGGDPKFNTSTWALGAGSVLLNKGPEEPQFNDHDGSRNDIGNRGGHAYDPTGTSSVNPVVLSGTQNIIRMNVGATTPIQIKARAAVATPAN